MFLQDRPKQYKHTHTQLYIHDIYVWHICCSTRVLSTFHCAGFYWISERIERASIGNLSRWILPNLSSSHYCHSCDSKKLLGDYTHGLWMVKNFTKSQNFSKPYFSFKQVTTHEAHVVHTTDDRSSPLFPFPHPEFVSGWRSNLLWKNKHFSGTLVHVGLCTS